MTPTPEQLCQPKYGFYTETYADGTSIETLMTGDGKAQFTDCHFEDGTASIGISYGNGTGISTQQSYEAGTTATDIGVKWQIKFERQESVDAMIVTLLKVKNCLRA